MDVLEEADLPPGLIKVVTGYGRTTGEPPMSSEWHWHPDLPIPNSPVFDWPPRPLAACKWLAGYWLAISMIVIEVATACLVWYFLQPAPERTATFALEKKKRMELGDFFHQLHHRYFECNYGTVEMPWDRWFGSFDDGTPEARQRIRSRMKLERGRATKD